MKGKRREEKGEKGRKRKQMREEREGAWEGMRETKRRGH